MTSIPEEVTLRALFALVRARRRLLLLFAVLPAIASYAWMASRPTLYESSALVLLQSRSAGDFSQLRGLASQFGIQSPATGGFSIPAELVIELVKSRSFLEHLASEGPGKVDERSYFGYVVGESASRSSRAATNDLPATIGALKRQIEVNFEKRTGAIRISTRARESASARQLAETIVRLVDSTVFEISRRRAASERAGLEDRILAQRKTVEKAENEMASFLIGNRQYQGNPALSFKFDRLQREVTLHQQILVGLMQSREQAASRETRVGPEVAVIEAPQEPFAPVDNRALAISLMAAFVGTVVFLALMAIKAWS